MHIREAQFPILIIAHGTHESIRHADGNVEVCNLILIGLAGNEFFDIGMIHAQDAHVRTGRVPPCAISPKA